MECIHNFHNTGLCLKKRKEINADMKVQSSRLLSAKGIKHDFLKEAAFQPNQKWTFKYARLVFK